jgi:hypothetical protein
MFATESGFFSIYGFMVTSFVDFASAVGADFETGFYGYGN